MPRDPAGAAAAKAAGGRLSECSQCSHWPWTVLPGGFRDISKSRDPDAKPESQAACQRESYLYPTTLGVCFRPIADVLLPALSGAMVERMETLVWQKPAEKPQ